MAAITSYAPVPAGLRQPNANVLTSSGPKITADQLQVQIFLSLSVAGVDILVRLFLTSCEHGCSQNSLIHSLLPGWPAAFTWV